MRLSRIGQHIKDEPCAKQRALLGVIEISDLRTHFWIVIPSIFAERGFQPTWANIAYYVYMAILGLRNASETVE